MAIANQNARVVFFLRKKRLATSCLIPFFWLYLKQPLIILVSEVKINDFLT